MRRTLLGLIALIALLPCVGCITGEVIDARMAESLMPDQKPYKPEPIIPPKVTKFDLDVVGQKNNIFTLRMGAEVLTATCDGEWINYAVQGNTWVSGNCGPIEAEIGQHAAMTQTEGDLDSPAGHSILRYICDPSKCTIPTVVVLGIETIDQRKTREQSELAAEYRRQQAEKERQQAEKERQQAEKEKADQAVVQLETDRLSRVAASEAEGRRVRAEADKIERERLAAPERARKTAEYAAQQAAEQKQYAENYRQTLQREKNAADAFDVGATWGLVKKYCKKHPEGAWRANGHTDTCINTALGWTKEDYCTAARGHWTDSACPTSYY